MKVFAGISVVAATTSYDQRACPDQELADQCEAGCTSELGICLSGCSDASCQEKCYTNYNNCSFRCPCNIFCPDGCAGCENEICPPEGCPDQDLADQCEAGCSADLGNCLVGCSNADCQESCFNAYNNCSFRCPCNIFCPDGCVDCDNAICGGDGGNNGGGARRIIHLGDPETTSNLVFFATDEFGDLFEPLDLTLPESGSSSFSVLNGAGYAVWKDEVYSFGGYATYGEEQKRILKLVPDACEFQLQSLKLRYNFSGVSGSVAVWDGGIWEPEGVYLCFGSWEGGRSCERFEGTSTSGVSSARKSHRESAMCVYDGRLLAVGGTNDDSQYAELFSWEWNPAVAHPEGTQYAPCLSVDEGVLFFSRGSLKVWLFSNFEWNVVGSFVKDASRFTLLPLDNNTIMMYPGYKGKAAYRTIWDGEKIVESTEQLTNGQLRYDNTVKPIVFEGVLNCPVPSV